MVSVINVADVDMKKVHITKPVIFNFYVVNIKRNCEGKIKYGQQYYDFDEGIMLFVAPKQRVELEESGSAKLQGWNAQYKQLQK